MALFSQENQIVPQAITETSTTQNHQLGKIIRVKDTLGSSGNGEAEVIYLKGVASTIVGSLVVYDQSAGTSTLAVSASRGPAAIALSANVASQYGWYQLTGSVAVKAGTVISGAAVYATSTAGQVDDAVVTAQKLDGALFKTADGTPSAGLAMIQIDRPSLNGNG